MVYPHSPGVPVSDSALLIIIHADAHSSSSRTRAFIIHLLLLVFDGAQVYPPYADAHHLHRGRAPSSSIYCCSSLTAHSSVLHMRTRIIFIADARLHHRVPVLDGALLIIHADAHSSSSRTRALIIYLLLPVLGGAQFIIHADAHSSSSRTRALILYLLLLILDGAQFYPLSSISYFSLKTVHSILNSLSCAAPHRRRAPSMIYLLDLRLRAHPRHDQALSPDSTHVIQPLSRLQELQYCAVTDSPSITRVAPMYF
ncbi:hypothetical protein R3P38DRAFT_3167499 [Favolaschia claudopus]|uniref:Uncharacterized protein n=1 Tax=Favolaschia claudopus TaxID=2862362 RepID=A0AAW0EE69_9AGAR